MAIVANHTVTDKHGYGILHHSERVASVVGAVTEVNIRIKGDFSGGGNLGVGGANNLALHVTHLGFCPDGDVIGHGDGVNILAPQFLIQAVENLGIGRGAGQGHVQTVSEDACCRSEDGGLYGLLNLGKGGIHKVGVIIALFSISGIGHRLGHIELATLKEVHACRVVNLTVNNLVNIDRSIVGGTRYRYCQAARELTAIGGENGIHQLGNRFGILHGDNQLLDAAMTSVTIDGEHHLA